MADAPTTAYTEVQIDNDSISLTLISESAEGVTIEDTERLTFEELQDMAGEHFTLSLSGDSQQSLSEQRRDANVGRIMQSDTLEERAEDLPQAGEVVYDQNAPDWSQDGRVEVVEVLSNVTAEEYVIQGRHEGSAIDPSLQSWNDETVADANPSYSSDEPVIIGTYFNGGDSEYAFPAGRLDSSFDDNTGGESYVLDEDGNAPGVDL